MPSPRSALFPYTTLFRSSLLVSWAMTMPRLVDGSSTQRWTTSVDRAKVRFPVARSEERFSRNAEPEICTLSLHDALPIFLVGLVGDDDAPVGGRVVHPALDHLRRQGEGPLSGRQIGRAVQQECRARDLHSFPTRRSSDLPCWSRGR